MSSNINLFLIVDSKKQYDEFIALAMTDYEELKNQISTHFQPGMTSDLREYKANILAEHEYNNDDNDLLTNLYLGIFLPATLSYLSTMMVQGVENDVLKSFINFMISVIIFAIFFFYIIKHRKSKKRTAWINKQRAIIFLENFEI